MNFKVLSRKVKLTTLQEDRTKTQRWIVGQIRTSEYHLRRSYLITKSSKKRNYRNMAGRKLLKKKTQDNFPEL